MAKSDLIHVQVEGNVFEGKADELAKLLEEGGKTVDAQGNADLWQWSISSDNKLIINEIFRSNEAWLGQLKVISNLMEMKYLNYVVLKEFKYVDL